MVRNSVILPFDTASKYEPIRTCAGCRERQPQALLVRLNLIDGKVILLKRGRISLGRSVYLCPRDGCFNLAAKRGRLDFKRSKTDRVSVSLSQAEWFILKGRFGSRVREMAARCS